MSGKTIIKYYPSEHYTSVFDKTTGLSIRKEDDGYEEPFWAEHGPELLDVSITNYCTNNCQICYRDSNPQGNHISLAGLEIILKQAKELDVRQIALGGGNPNQHPQFIEILEMIRCKYEIIPSYTTNGIGLTQDIIDNTKKFCGVVAVSVSSFSKEKYQIIDRLINKGIKTNIHFVVTKESISEAIQLLEGKKSVPQGLNAIIFLNYKPVGNLKNAALNSRLSEEYEYFFSLVSQCKLSCNIGFDSCFVSGISKHTNINPLFYDYCEAGRFSAFIDENLNMVPCSFVNKDSRRISLNDMSMIDVWKNSEIFVDFRNRIKTKNCDCKFWNNCHGGCPCFDINFC
jgi:radical SAM protein with 4Fe4S-binding SPASM domain